MTHHSNNSVRDHMKWAGLLGCEAVLSSMALMQANNIPAQKKMMSSSGHGHRSSPEGHQTHSQHSLNHHGHQVHHGQGHHSHMGHASDGSCPPLVRELHIVFESFSLLLLIVFMSKPADDTFCRDNRNIIND
ncbi:hypothetical protein XENOCAPTIV_027060 [Xenoophorus captivus]|uniref:Uncharacterized protein n=1 Tax=Xenoophorus captivus TaxID=1517983 RepID=A0ABV0RDQ1_9TELE